MKVKQWLALLVSEPRRVSCLILEPGGRQTGIMLLTNLLVASLSNIAALANVEPRSTSSPNVQAYHNDTAGSFTNPAPRTRPKFRYWIPDASVDTDVVASDVKAAGDVGMGGMELLGYYLYGGPPSNGAGRGTYAPVDWARYGFGEQAWGELTIDVIDG